MIRLLIILLFFSQNVFADVSYEVADDDAAKMYLGTIFGGDVGTTELSYRSATPLIGDIIGLINGIILSISLVVVGYITFLATINTAQEGEFLGRKFNSLWVPAKTVVSMMLIAPSSTNGYCLAQSMVMWVILNGMGAANSVWQEIKVNIDKGLPSINTDLNEINNDKKYELLGRRLKLSHEVFGIYQIATCAGIKNAIIQYTNSGEEELKPIIGEDSKFRFESSDNECKLEGIDKLTIRRGESDKADKKYRDRIDGQKEDIKNRKETFVLELANEISDKTKNWYSQVLDNRLFENDGNYYLKTYNEGNFEDNTSNDNEVSSEPPALHIIESGYHKNYADDIQPTIDLKIINYLRDLDSIYKSIVDQSEGGSSAENDNSSGSWIYAPSEYFNLFLKKSPQKGDYVSTYGENYSEKIYGNTGQQIYYSNIKKTKGVNELERLFEQDKVNNKNELFAFLYNKKNNNIENFFDGTNIYQDAEADNPKNIFKFPGNFNDVKRRQSAYLIYSGSSSKKNDLLYKDHRKEYNSSWDGNDSSYYDNSDDIKDYAYDAYALLNGDTTTDGKVSKGNIYFMGTVPEDLFIITSEKSAYAQIQDTIKPKASGIDWDAMRPSYWISLILKKYFVQSLMEAATKSDPQHPNYNSKGEKPALSELQSIGTNVMNICEITIDAIIGSYILIGGGLMAAFAFTPLGSSSLPNVSMKMMNTFLFLVFACAGSSWFFGAAIGLYVPSIPIIIYGGVVLSWFVSVIQCVLGAPLIALSLTNPGQDSELGGAMEGIKIVVETTIKPIFIVLGFLITVKVIDIFLGYSFYICMQIIMTYARGKDPSISSVDDVYAQDLGLAYLWIFVLFCSIITGVVSQASNLISKIPDEILRFAGISPSQPSNREFSDLVKSGSDGANKVLSSGIKTAGDAINKTSSTNKSQAPTKPNEASTKANEAPPKPND